MWAPRSTVMVATLLSGLVSGCIAEGKPAASTQGETDGLVLDTSGDATSDASADASADAREDVDATPEEVTGSPSGDPCEKDDDCRTGHCLLGRDGRACAFDCAVTDACPIGLECGSVGGDRMCVDRYVFACRPCERDAECNGGAAAGDADGGENECVRIDSASTSGRFCGVRCGGVFGDCLPGYACVGDQCRPSDGTCECSVTAVSLASTTSCSVSAAEDTRCFGRRVCTTVGAEASACDAQTPAQERCDGLDNDCDGVTDEAVDCGDFACKGELGCATSCVSNDDCAAGLACDVADRDGDLRTDECAATGEDGTRCTLGLECDSGYCNNARCCDGSVSESLCCARDSDCAALDGAAECTTATANGCVGTRTFGSCIDSICQLMVAPAPDACVGQVCRGAQCLAEGVLDGVHLCDPSGECLATADVSCDDGNVCTMDTCNASAGCTHAPTSGETADACYTFAATTRGIGACKEGVIVCQNGARSACKGEIGPNVERCNGIDDDCDGRTDEDTEGACFPYLCGGAGGCLRACGGNEDCAAGNYCDSEHCAGTGENGSMCEDDSQCKSDHCGGGVCCEEGLCCRNSEDCAALDDVLCDVARLTGCAGARVMGVCDETKQCREERVEDPSACDGRECAPASCDGDAVLPPGLCESTQCVRAAREPCSPFACDLGACLDGCSLPSDCADGAQCIDATCRELPNGGVCNDDDECASGHCDNGFCCASGVCCGADDAACSGLDSPGTCSNANGCAGTRIDGQCGADHQCAAVQVSDPTACLGRSCGASACVNLTGGEFTLEGLVEKQCDATGTCATFTRDCSAGPGGACTSASALFVACQDCTPSRTTCVIYDSPCHCE